VDGVLCDDRLARPCRSGHEHGAALVESVERFELEPVERVRAGFEEACPDPGAVAGRRHLPSDLPMRIEPS
jgi:hypothetical protein